MQFPTTDTTIGKPHQRHPQLVRGVEAAGADRTLVVRVKMDLDEVPRLIGRLYEIVDRFEQLFPGRKFTPDGHLVGSIGEVIAANLHDLELLPPRAEASSGPLG